MPLFFLALSVLGVLVGIFLIRQGIGGDGLGAITTLIVGIFFTIKEVMDMIFAK